MRNSSKSRNIASIEGRGLERAILASKRVRSFVRVREESKIYVDE